MQRTLMYSLVVALLAAAGFGGYVAFGRPIIIEPRAKPEMAGGRDECPHDPARGDSVLTKVVGALADIPELHDCQRLVVPDSASGALVYDSIAAVFAVPRGATYTDDSLATPRALALIYFPYGGTYERLHLETPMSCLWVQRMNTGLAAWIRPVATAEDCLLVSKGESDRSRALEVRTHTITTRGSRPEPPPYNVARWDWDERTRTQFIGIRCGNAWCEVGVRNFGDSPSHVDANTETAPQFSGLRIKGHYDEQHLAEFAGGRLQVGGNRGTIYPTPQLAAFAATRPPPGVWTRVAEINMSPDVGSYDAMLNLIGNPRPVTAGDRAVLSLCLGDPKSCAPNRRSAFRSDACKATGNGRWYARIERPGRPAQYFCVMHRGHTKADNIPAVVRWRWREDDETIWVRCHEGCCEVNVDET